MKFNSFNKLIGGVLLVLLCTALELPAQQRAGGGGFGGGGFGGFGGFGGGRGFGGGGFGGGGNSTSSGQYNNNGTVGTATISVDPTTHTLTVIADKQTRDQIERVIESLDAPEPQVLIKVVFLEVQHNNNSEIGVQGTYTGNPFGTSIAQLTGYVTNFSLQHIVTSVTSNGITSSTSTPTTVSTLTPTYQSVNLANGFNLPASVAGASGNGGMYQMLGNDFTATIQAIAAAGKSEVLSRPSILARDGQMATIQVGQSIYLPSGVQYASSGSISGAVIPTIQGTYTPVGIILYVTPFIGANGLVEMILQPENISVDSSTPGQVITYGSSLIGSSPVYAPNLNVTEANTVVVTPNGQTIVIGGLISNTKSSADSKVPFIGDIPILGQLFRASAKAESKSELLMFLTPHIIAAPSQLGAMSTAEMNQTRLITNSVSEQELDRFLERVPVKKKK